MAENIEVVVSLKDEISSKLNDIKNSMRDFDAMADSSKKLAMGITAITAAATGVAVYAVTQAKEAVRGQQELQAVLESTNGVAGMTAESVNELATSLSLATNFTDDQVLSAENMLLTFTKIGADVFPAATEATLNMAEKFGSVEAASVQLGKALNDPIEGVTALRRVGVALTQAQEDSIKKFVEMGDIASAQKVILDELGTEFGGLARAVADPVIQVKNQLGEMAEALGMKLLPYVNQAAEAFLEWMESMGGIDGIFEKIKNAFIVIQPYLPIIAGALIGGLVPALILATLALWGFVAPLLIPMAIGAAIVVAIMLIRAAIQNFGELATAVSILVVDGWENIKEKAQTIFRILSEDIMDIWNGIKDFFAIVWDGIIAVVNFAIEGFLLIVNGFLDLIFLDWEAAWNGIKLVTEILWNAMVVFFDNFLKGLKFIWNESLSAIKTTGENIWNGIKFIFSNAWAYLSGLFNSGKDLLSAAWSSMWDVLTSKATAAWEGVKNVVKDSINWIIDKVNSLIRAANAVTAKIGGPKIPMLQPLTFSQGGIVPTIDWSPVGTDTVPALLTPGERVLTKEQAQSYGGGGWTVIINNPVVMTEDDIVERLGDPLINVLKQHFAV